MKKYLLVKEYGDSFTTDELTKQNLVELAQGLWDWIFDLGEGTYFDKKSNSWIKIQVK